MELRVFVCQCAFALVAVCVNPFSSHGQDVRSNRTQSPTNDFTGNQFSGTPGLSPIGSRVAGQEFAETDDPYRMTSRIHLQRGATTGYLVLKVELKKGSHIYSLTQTGLIPPTKIKVSTSRQFRLTGKFSPDRPAAVTEFDPIMQQRVEEHSGIIQFFAPIEVVGGVKPSTLTANLVFDGQVCTDENLCMPISGVKVAAKFSGYFDQSAKKRTTSQNGLPTSKPATGSKRIHR